MQVHDRVHQQPGAPLSSDRNYRVNLRQNIPAGSFWSVTLYEAENASGLANDQPFPSLGLRDKPAQNADGSTDLSLEPKVPKGKEANLLATVPAKGISQASGSKARAKPRSTRAGSQAISRR